MKRNNRKAQASTEYMIILAVVIIIALIVVSVLGGIPGIGSGASAKASAAFWKTADLALLGYAFINDNTAANDAKFIVRNNFPTTIVIQAINISTTGSGSPTVQFYSGSLTLGPGTQKTLTENLNTNNPCYGKSAGDSYSINIKFKYLDQETGSTFVYTGAGNQLKGQCAKSLS